jgi:hypothetical protein
MRSSLLESIIVKEFKTTEVSSSLGLAKANYSIIKLSVVGKEDASVRIHPNNSIASEYRKST